MFLAINFSTQSAVLYQLGKIKLNRFKCPDWPDLISEASRYCPVAVHFGLSAGRGRIKKKDWDEIKRIAEHTQTPFINIHLESRRQDFPEIALRSADSKHQEQVFRHMIEEVQIAAKFFGAERIIVENVPYRLNGNVLRASVEPAVIRRVVQETGCGFLLDIPHARITANQLGMDEREYIASLPVHRLKELHFTGLENLDGWLQDHTPAQPEDWALLDWVLEQIRSGGWPRPWLLALEYGGVGEKFSWRTDADRIQSQCLMLSEGIARIGPTPSE